jgi:hemolysin III
VAIYLALGWLVLIALKPIIANVAWVALLLLCVGGLLYSTGVVFYLNKRLKFARAIWHGHVVAAAGAHWAAVLLGVVLASR